MWFWGFLGWIAVSGLAVVLHHRFRRLQPSIAPEVAAFLLRLETVIAENHPRVEYRGMLPDQFACLLCVDGQETPVALHDAFRHCEAFPDGFPNFVATLVADILEVGLDRIHDLDLSDVTALLMPQVRSRQWLEEKGCFGDSGLVHQRLNAELVTVYVVDDPHCMVFVCRAHLKHWRKSEQDVHNLALSNLARRWPAREGDLRDAADAVRVESGDGYDAARVLLLDQVEGLLVAIPDRDLLWIGSERGVDLESLMADTEEISGRSAHPISPRVYRVREGRLEAVQDAEGS